jgi:hypothetical protein
MQKLNTCYETIGDLAPDLKAPIFHVGVIDEPIVGVEPFKVALDHRISLGSGTASKTSLVKIGNGLVEVAFVVVGVGSIFGPKRQEN